MSTKKTLNLTPAGNINTNGVKTLSGSGINQAINTIDKSIDTDYIKEKQTQQDTENSLAKAKQINDKYNTVQLLNNLHNSISQLDQVTDDDNENTIKEKANKIKQLMGQASEVANQYGLTNTAANLLQNGDKEANSIKSDIYNKYSMNLANKIIKSEFVDNINNQEDMYQKAQKVYSYADNISDPEIKAHYLKAVSDLLAGDKDKIADDHRLDMSKDLMNQRKDMEGTENKNVTSFFKDYQVTNKDGSVKPIDDIYRDFESQGYKLDNSTKNDIYRIYNNKVRILGSSTSNKDINKEDINNLNTSKDVLYLSPNGVKEGIFDSNGNLNKKTYNQRLKSINEDLSKLKYTSNIAKYITFNINEADPEGAYSIPYDILKDPNKAERYKQSLYDTISVYGKYSKDKDTLNSILDTKNGTVKLDKIRGNTAKVLHDFVSLVQSGKIKRYIQQNQQYLKDLASSGKTNIKISNLAFNDISDPNKLKVVSNKILQDNWSSLVKGNISEKDFIDTLSKHKVNSNVINALKPTLDKIEAIKNFATSAKLKTFNYRYNSKTGLPELAMTLSNDNLKQLAIHYVFNDKLDKVNYKQLKAVRAYLKSAITEMGIPYINGNKIIINSDTLSKMQHALYQYKYRLANKE